MQIIECPPNRRNSTSGIEAGMRGERAMVRAARAQRNHIGMAIRAFVRLEWHRVRTGISWGMAKEGIIRRAVRSYLAHPWYTLPATA